MEHIRQATLLITKSCNLHCQYCYVRKGNVGVMSFETAQRIVSELLDEDSGGYDFTEITFFGGEPFLEFELIKKISEWIWSRTWTNRYILTATTNGTLLDYEKKQWLTKNRNRFILTLSYDGTDAQNFNRSFSSEKIDIDFFYRNYPEIPFKMTIYEDTVQSFASDFIQLREQGIKVTDTFAGGMSPWSETSLKILDVQLEKICEYELSHESSCPSNLLSVNLLPVALDTKELPECRAGESRIAFDTDGKQYRCHLMSPLVLSSDEMSILKKEKHSVDMNNICRSCILDSICPYCEGMSFRLFHSFGHRNKTECSLFKHQVYFACRFQSKKILRKNTLNDNDKLTLSAVAKIMKSFRNANLKII